MKTNLHTTPAPGRPRAPSPARAAILLSAMLAFVPAAQAASITWGTVANVDTANPAGTIRNSSSGAYSEYVDAVTTYTTDLTVNSVLFHKFTQSTATPFYDSIGNISVATKNTDEDPTFTFGTTLNNDYDRLLNFTAFHAVSIDLSGLTPDRQYQIQVWAPLCSVSVNGTLYDGVKLISNTVTQTVVGTFTADATTQTLAIADGGNGYGIEFFPGAVSLFAKPDTVMEVVTLDATGVSSVGLAPFSATLNGTINPGGGPDAAASFNWGPTAGYGNTVAATPSPVSGSGAQAVSAVISGLAASTTYHFQAVGNNGSAIYGSDMTFTTPAQITTGAATAITDIGATLNGTVNPNGVATTAWFEWGTDTSYGTTTSPHTDVGSGSDYASFDAPLTGLAPTTTYHFRAVANDGTTTVQGPDMVFTTPAQITTEAATAVTYDGATLNGTVNPNGVATTAWFEWGTDTSYGNTTSPHTDVGSSSDYADFNAPITGLAATTTYHFRAVANNGTDTVQGPDMVFTTPRHNAIITWSGATGANLGDPAEVLKGGTYSEYVDAVTCAPIDHTVNDVVFHAFTSYAANSPSGWNHSGGKIAYTYPAAGPGGYATAPTTNYGETVAYTVYTSGSGSIEFSGLEIGREYQVQAWAPAWYGDPYVWHFNMDGLDYNTSLSPTYRVGTFTAVESTQGIPITQVDYLFTPGAVSLFARPVSGTTYEVWASTHGIPGEPAGGDYDGDAMTNFQEYAFGLDPTKGSSVNPIKVLLDKVAGTFSYTRTAGSGLTYTVWTSTDLQTWDGPAAASQTPRVPVVDGVETVDVQLTGYTPPPGGTLFARVKAE
ncbi:MAG: hypothetical protein NTW21_42410 [Verrucomicrobia bacterium]|nr:hypothetical protein [Verrucomicrobiota bacterium]